MERLEEKEISDSKFEGEKFKLFQEYGLKCRCRDVMIRLSDEVLEGAEDWSLKCLMASCLDFAKEMTALQHVDSELRVSVLVTRKFHTEPAGEGIEHSWGVTKGVYQRKPLNSKRSKESFKGLVQECTNREILTTKTVRKLSRRARAYTIFMRARAGETTLQHSLCPSLNAFSRHSKSTGPPLTLMQDL